jgi:flagellar assembly protein FliH
MLKTSLEVKPELVLPVVREAIDYLPSLQQPALLQCCIQKTRCWCASRWAHELAGGGWRIVEDEHMERGGCRVETPSNRIDATTPRAGSRIAQGLGKDDTWMAP